MNLKKYILKSIALSIIIFIIFLSSSSSFASTPNTVTMRNLAMFASLAYANLEEIPNYNIPLSTDVNNLTFYSIDIPTDSQLEEITTNAVLFQER